MNELLDWIARHREVLGLALQAITAVVWMVYLQLLVTSWRRQRKCNILITRVAGNRDHSHMMVGNMGAEPIFVTSVIADLSIDGQWHRTVVSDPSGLSDDKAEYGSSSKGPLDRAKSRDIGSFKTLMRRGLDWAGIDASIDDISAIVVTVMAESSQDSFLVAGRQSFRVIHDGEGRRIYLPQQARTEHIRSRFSRRRLHRDLTRMLREEAASFETQHD